MARLFFIIAIFFWVSACSAQDENYYLTHPQQLQTALQTCPEKTSANISCEALKKLAQRMNQLGFELRSNPQTFGKKILALQETLGQQQKALKKQPNSPDLSLAMKANQQRLKELLAVVRWLESPEG